MRYGYYPGCSLEGVSAEYDESMRSLFKQLGVVIEDLPGWICCGTLAAPSMSRLLGLATPLWNVARAKQAGFDRLVAPCSACAWNRARRALSPRRAARAARSAGLDVVVVTSVQGLVTVINRAIEAKAKELKVRLIVTDAQINEALGIFDEAMKLTEN